MAKFPIKIPIIDPTLTGGIQEWLAAADKVRDIDYEWVWSIEGSGTNYNFQEKDKEFALLFKLTWY